MRKKRSARAGTFQVRLMRFCLRRISIDTVSPVSYDRRIRIACDGLAGFRPPIDVITSIGGRKPANPSHAMRILRSYETGETVSIEILRKQKRMSLTWKVPARADRFFRMHREREEHEDQSGLRHLQLRRRVHLQRA